MILMFPSNFLIFLLEKFFLSKTITLKSFINNSTKCEPIKPAPPNIKTVFLRLLFKFFHLLFCQRVIPPARFLKIPGVFILGLKIERGFGLAISMVSKQRG